MSKPTMQAASELLDEVFQACTRLLRYSAHLIRGMSPPALLGAALLIAFLLSILPLALVLFATFMLVKLAVGACVIGARRQRRAARQQPLP